MNDQSIVEPLVAMASAEIARKLAPKPKVRAQGLKTKKRARRKAERDARRRSRR